MDEQRGGVVFGKAREGIGAGGELRRPGGGKGERFGGRFAGETGGAIDSSCSPHSIGPISTGTSHKRIVTLAWPSRCHGFIPKLAVKK
jgi:hypothetical protein